jgi:UDPglucose 6-dehydrogenase
MDTPESDSLGDCSGDCSGRECSSTGETVARVRVTTVRLTVIGTGYLGATHAACMADLGHDVVGYDLNPAKVALLSSGRVPFYEPGLEAVLQRALSSGRLRFTSEISEVAAFGDVHFLCVGTPQRAGANAADMGQVDGAIEALAPLLTRPCLVVGKSTVPVGTAQRLVDRLQSVAPAGVGVDLAWNPEFLREGFAVQDTVSPDRLVIGVQTPEAEKVLREVYGSILESGVPIIVADFPTAELVKTAANAFLATKISFINAMAEICEATGADVSVLAESIGHDTRIGSRFLRAGVGFGGGCLPKDIRAFIARAEEVGAGEALAFLREVDGVNLRRRTRTVEMAREMVGGDFTGKNITVLGATFKPDSDDVRDSPALEVAASMMREGAHVCVHDPKGIDNARARFPDLSYEPDVMTAVRDADLLVHLTEWNEYRALDPAVLNVRGRKVLDGRLALDPMTWRNAGWTYAALGRPNA